MKVCEIEGCGRAFLAKKMCSMHYGRHLRGMPIDAPSRNYGTIEDRFWPKVNRTDGCWEWTASRNAAGYGVLGRKDGGSRLAHRISYEIHHGPIADGLEVDHMCHNTACVNPSHLRAVDSASNIQNRAGAARTSRSGFRGVRRFRDTNRWTARAQLNGKYYHIGYFGSPEEASAAVTAWRRENMPYSEMDKKDVA